MSSVPILPSLPTPARRTWGDGEVGRAAAAAAAATAEVLDGDLAACVEGAYKVVLITMMKQETIWNKKEGKEEKRWN